MPPEPHPRASVRPGAPLKTRRIQVDAATVDTWMRDHGLALFRDDGWKGGDSDYYARVEVLRADDGGVIFELVG